MDTVSFNVSRKDRTLIEKITKRAVQFCRKNRVDLDPVSTNMDLAATHANGNPLRLRDMLESGSFDLMHDITGIALHINRETGKLEDHFLPRFSLTKQRNMT